MIVKFQEITPEIPIKVILDYCGFLQILLQTLQPILPKISNIMLILFCLSKLVSNLLFCISNLYLLYLLIFSNCETLFISFLLSHPFGKIN